VSGGITVDKNWRQQYNKQLTQLLEYLDILSFVRIKWLNCIEYLDILSFVRIKWLNCIGTVNRMESKGKVSKVFDNNPQGS
jgi:hypothetical protein